MESVPSKIEGTYFEFVKLTGRRPHKPQPEKPQPIQGKPRHFALDSTTNLIPLATLIHQQLLDGNAASGYIYVYTKGEARGFVKIGYTTQRAEERLRQWTCTCGQIATVQYVSSWVPNAKRVERLVHVDLQLAGKRFEEKNCTGCSDDHNEWFNINIEDAMDVVQHWSTWMADFRPYEAGTGFLTPQATRDMVLGVVEDTPESMRRFLSNSAGDYWCQAVQLEGFPLDTSPLPAPMPAERASAPSKMQSAKDSIGPDVDLSPLAHPGHAWSRRQSVQISPTPKRNSSHSLQNRVRRLKCEHQKAGLISQLRAKVSSTPKQRSDRARKPKQNLSDSYRASHEVSLLEIARMTENMKGTTHPMQEPFNIEGDDVFSTQNVNILSTLALAATDVLMTTASAAMSTMNAVDAMEYQNEIQIRPNNVEVVG